ncbi:MAG: hypothetical protein ACTSVV_12835 [Promethearchaeota archaeon]
MRKKIIKTDNDLLINILTNILNKMDEVLQWLKIQNINTLKEIIETLNDKEKLVYNLSDERSSRDIEKIINVSHSTITLWWKKWYKLGIMKESKKYKGRYIHFYSLDDLNIQIPKILNNKNVGDKNE